MTRHDDSVALQHMRDHAVEAIAAANHKTRQDLDNDRILALALIKLVEITGEAAARVSSATRKLEPAIPWNDIVAARNRLVHGYDQVDLDILWRIVTAELPRLVQQLQALLSAHSRPDSQG